MAIYSVGFELHQWTSVESPPNERIFKRKYSLTSAMPELQLAALCWELVCAYLTIANTIQHPQGEEEVWIWCLDNRVAKPRDQWMVLVTPIVKMKQWKRKSVYLVREEACPKRLWEGKVEGADCSKTGPSQKQEEKQTERASEGNSCQAWRKAIPSSRMYVSQASGLPWREVSSTWGN